MGFCTERNLEDFRCNGHHMVRTPDGFEEDYDTAIPRYIAMQMGSNGEYVDSNGSEHEVHGTVDNLTVVYDICEHEFEGGIKVDGSYVARGSLVEDSDHGAIFVVKSVHKAQLDSEGRVCHEFSAGRKGEVIRAM